MLISSYALGGDEDEDVPLDAFELNFVKLAFDYFSQKADGSLDAGTHGGWDLKKNVKI